MGAQLNSRRRGGLSLLFTFSLLLLLASSAILVYELVAFSRREELLPSGITVAGIGVSGIERTRCSIALGKQLCGASDFALPGCAWGSTTSDSPAPRPNRLENK